MMSNHFIHWGNIAKAVEFYRGAGFEYIEVPWIVPERDVAVTLPTGKESVKTQLGTLVGSAEQSFICLMRNKLLVQARYVAATPCFRDEQVDDLHKVYFFKVELIERVSPDLPQDSVQKSVMAMASTALEFFKSLPGGKRSLIKPTSEGLDITLDGTELGSYGFRTFEHQENYTTTKYAWVYGTGYADPRFSYVSSWALISTG